jgi:hypothetical protein
VAVDERDQGRQQDQAMLQRAAQLRAPLMRAARSAGSNCMGYLVFGVLTVLVTVAFSSPMDASDFAALGVAVVLLFVGLRGRQCAARLRNGDAEAARLLARNELLLLGAIGIYCALMLTVINPMTDEIDSMLGSTGTHMDTEGLRRTVYVSVFAVTLLYQGGMALRFRRVVPAAELYLAEVPDWAREAVASLPG